MAKKAPMVRWYSSPIVRPELMFASPVEHSVARSSRRYKFNSGNADKSSLNCMSEYFGSKILLAIVFALAQSVCCRSMADHKMPLGGFLLICDMRACMVRKQCAELVGKGTRRMRRTSPAPLFCTTGGTTAMAVAGPVFSQDASEQSFRTCTGGASRIQVQMFSCVPMAKPSSSWRPLNLNSPSAVANSWPSGNPMICTPAWAGSRTRKVTSWMQ
mmetsp:Transcript_76295/g.213997  ORF Transcript_76295/g.213997 Transcript_76295/m.213997 type:complete len:215 (+) Transcript_76295:688-1332(+)